MKDVTDIVSTRISRALSNYSGERLADELQDELRRVIFLALQPYNGRKMDGALMKEMANTIDTTIESFLQMHDELAD